MSANFNPYAEWLGIDARISSPNHYQLLGIDKTVTDPTQIASAADRAMTKVRACKPGANAPAWAALLDRITEAKATLSDPGKRAAYEQTRQAKKQAAASGIKSAAGDPNLLPPSQSAPVAPVAVQPVAQPAASAAPAPQVPDPMAPVAPVPVVPQAAVPQAATPQPVQPTPAAPAPQAVPYLQPAPAATGAANPMAPVAPAVPNPMAPIAQAVPAQAAGVPAASPVPMAPMQPTAVPVASPVPVAPVPAAPVAASTAQAAPMLAPQPAPAADAAPKLARKTSATARARSKSGGSLGPILLGVSVGGLIVIVVGVGFWLMNAEPEQGGELAGGGTATQPVGVVESPPSTMPRRLDEIPENERPKPEVFELPYDEPDPIGMTPNAMTSNTMTPSTAPMEVAPSEPMTSMTPEPISMSDPMAESAPTSEELRALAKSMTAARTAIGKQDLAMADREIAAAMKAAKLEEHKAMVNRLMLLRNYVGRFLESIDETLSRVDAGDQITIDGDRSFGIVEKSPELLVIRMNGKNLRYSMTELPAGLANRLAEMSLDKDAPETAAMKATFVSINPKVDTAALEKAKTWWEEAAGMADVQDLITAINDDYSLQADLLDVAMNPDSMQDLAELADRLKDATTIDAFAAEYQAVIDEAIKSLEPDMELNVGGSTVVTIKELKPDRIMLTVADETRGFPYTKLPLGLAAALAERSVPRELPLAMVMKGAYFAKREQGESTKQFRPIVLEWWIQAGKTDEQLQPAIRELLKQYQ